MRLAACDKLTLSPLTGTLNRGSRIEFRNPRSRRIEQLKPG